MKKTSCGHDSELRHRCIIGALPCMWVSLHSIRYRFNYSHYKSITMSTHSFVKSKLNHNCQVEKETTRSMANLLRGIWLLWVRKDTGNRLRMFTIMTTVREISHWIGLCDIIGICKFTLNYCIIKWAYNYYPNATLLRAKMRD